MIGKYPPEVHEFVKTNCTKMRDDDLARACNEALGTEFTRSKMRAFRHNHSYRNGMTRYLSTEEYMARHYPPGMYEYIRDNSWGVSSREMAELVNEKYGTSFSPAMIKQFRQRHGIKSGETGWFRKSRPPGNKGKKLEEYVGPERAAEIKKKMARTQFKTGKKAWNMLPVGAVVVACNGYKMRKKQMNGNWNDRWELYHRWVWEQHHGPIPPGMQISFRNGDKMNCDISNLMILTAAESQNLTRWNLRSSNPEATDAGLKIVRLKQRTKEIRNGTQGKKGRTEGPADPE